MDNMKLKVIAIVAFCASLLLGCSEGTKKLHIYTWADYISPDLIQQFESANNCKVIVDTFDSNESMYAKLKSGASGYDIIVPTSYIIGALVKDGIIQKLDMSKLQNVIKNFDNRYCDKMFAPVLTYTVPYAITYGGLFYNKTKVDAKEVESWNVLLNPKYKGRVSLLDDIRETIGVGLFMNGFSLNSKKQEELNAAVEFIRKVKANIRKFDNESYKVEVSDGSSVIGHGYSSDAFQAILGDGEVAGREDLGIAFPKEGFTIACEELAIMSTSREIELAYAFIDFLYEPMNCKKNMEYILALTPNIEAEEGLNDKLRMILTLDPETLKRGQVTQSFDDDPAVMDMYSKAWDKIKASEEE